VSTVVFFFFSSKIISWNGFCFDLGNGCELPYFFHQDGPYLGFESGHKMKTTDQTKGENLSSLLDFPGNSDS
jgi:hypothetical protein